MNFAENTLIRLVSGVTPGPDSIEQLMIDPGNKEVFFASAGCQSNDVKLFTTQTLDQVINFRDTVTSPVRFVIGNDGASKVKKHRIIGHSDGQLKVYTIDQLKLEMVAELPLAEADHEYPKEEVTCGCYAPYGQNFAIGTS